MNTILFTIDVEDWFQVENFKAYIPYSTWDSLDMRVERNVHRILDLLDATDSTWVPDSGHTSRPKATFFILGWIAERVPGMVREIQDRGHEVASHGYDHDLCNRLTADALKKDLTESKQLLEDIVGQPVVGYRAPNFSVNNQILNLIESCGYRYDASYNSFEMNARYGRVDLSHGSRNGISYHLSDRFKELPLSNLRLFNHTIPFAGGGYFRLYPFPVLRTGIRQILKSQGVYHFYIHPWEIDAMQPRVTQASMLPRFRHYLNLAENLEKLRNLFAAFRDCRFASCRQYLCV